MSSSLEDNTISISNMNHNNRSITVGNKWGVDFKWQQHTWNRGVKDVKFSWPLLVHQPFDECVTFLTISVVTIDSSKVSSGPFCDTALLSVQSEEVLSPTLMKAGMVYTLRIEAERQKLPSCPSALLILFLIFRWLSLLHSFHSMHWVRKLYVFLHKAKTLYIIQKCII